MIKQECFAHLPNLPAVDASYAADARLLTYQWPQEHQLTSQITFAPAVKFMSTPFFRDLKDNVQANMISAAYFRNEPTSFYDWHTDQPHNQHGLRSCCINYLLSENAGALTMFRVDSYNRMNHTVQVCNYTLYQATLFNTQVPHAVANPTADSRYILSVSFFGADYQLVKDYLTTVKNKYIL